MGGSSRNGRVVSDTASIGTSRGCAVARYRPPLRDGRFWIVQGLVFGIFAVHTVLHVALGEHPGGVVIVVYTIPVLYAALEFGFRGSVATTALVVVLSLPYIVDDALTGARVDFVGHALELAVLVVVAPVVGWAVEAERAARRSHEAAEVRYRSLFEASGVPAVVLDAQGCVQEANPAAESLLGALTGTPLVDVLGEATLSAVLAPNPPARLDVAAGLQLHPIVSHLQGADGLPITQVLFQDVTEEAVSYRRARTWALAVLAGQEEERRRLTHELHDNALQLVVELRRLVERAARSASVEHELLFDARELADEILGELRTVAVRLRPPDLDDLGLVASLERLVDDRRRRGVFVDLEIDGTNIPLMPEISLALYRICQEALTNAEHHARASRILVRISFGLGEVTLAVSDDGIGFNVDRAEDEPESGHLGLLGMRERAQLMGGQLSIRSMPERGTLVVAEVPV